MRSLSTQFVTLSGLLLTMSVGLSACETAETPPPVSINTMCLIDREITYAPPAPNQQDTAANMLDTAETIAQIVAHNIVFARTCPPSEARNQPEGGSHEE